MSESALRERFGALWARLGGRGDGRRPCDDLLVAWQEPHRHYHGLDHLRDCLAQLDGFPAAGGARDPVEAALWFHDLIYLPGASDNEPRSADRALAVLEEGGVPGTHRLEVARLVRLTDHASAPLDDAGALVCDIDLSILGRPSAEFDEYERLIRAEYRDVPQPLYRIGRSRVLEAFLRREPLFRTPHFHARYEAQARRNLRRSLEAMGVA